MYLRRLRDLREDSDLTQEQLAKQIGITQRTYAFYEKGERQIPLYVLIRIADFYHTSTDYLLGRTDKK